MKSILYACSPGGGKETKVSAVNLGVPTIIVWLESILSIDAIFNYQSNNIRTVLMGPQNVWHVSFVVLSEMVK